MTPPYRIVTGRLVLRCWEPRDAPLLKESVANFQCRSVNRYYGGDHVIFLGAVEAYAYNKQEPLLFARGGFGRFIDGDGR